MLKFLRIFCFCCQVLVLVSCETLEKPTQKKLSDLQFQNERLRLEKAQLEKDAEQRKKDVESSKEKITVLENEKEDGEKNITAARQQIKKSFTALMQVCKDSEEDLYDCFFGNAPISRGMYLAAPQKILLIDRKNHVNVDKVIFCGAELCLENRATVQFCVLRPAREKKDIYVVEMISEEFICKTPGRAKIVFPRSKRLTAFNGYLVGMLVSPNAGIYYDACGTGVTEKIPMKKIAAGKTSVKLPYLPELSSPGKDLKSKSKAFSFRLFGSTYLD